MRRIITGAWIGVLVLVAAAALGFGVASQLAPERLRREIEGDLSAILHGPVSIAGVRFVPDWGPALEARNLGLWPGPEGPRLHVVRAHARLKLLPLLRGEVRLARLDLDGVTLRIERGRDGSWDPPPFQQLSTRPDPAAHSQPEKLLSPLIRLEAGVRRLLARPLLADDLRIRRGRVELVDATADAGTLRSLALSDFEGRVLHSSWLGSQVARARARLHDGQGPRGSLEWESRRRRDGHVRFALAATELDLSTLAPYLMPASRAEGSIEGRLSGVVTYETEAPGHGELGFDLLASDLQVRVPPPHASRLGPIEAERASARAVVAVTPQEVRVSEARIGSGELELRFEGAVERPLRPESMARLELAFREVALARALDFVGWLPEASREDAAAVVRPVEAGRLVALTARGSAPLQGWRSLLAGRSEALPAGLEVTGELRDARIRVGGGDPLAEVGGSVTWRGDRIEVRDARARLGDSPLPVLDLSLDGISNLLATHPSQRQLHSAAKPLPGMGALWSFLEKRDPSAPVATRLELQIDHLEHPMLLWPIENVQAQVELVPGGVHVAAASGTWAGATFEADADWLFEPVERVVVRARTGPPARAPHPTHPPASWARGQLVLGALHSGGWRQLGARGRFEASAGTVFLRDVAIDLDPAGSMHVDGSLDLARPGVVPFRLELAVHEGDVGALASQLGMPENAVTGRAELSGRFAGQLRRDRFLEELSGELAVTATDGEIQRKLPPVVALALASASVNPFAGRDSVRYSRAESKLAFADGVVRTEAFTLDGPDLRVVAAGQIDVARKPNVLEANVALFLFRQIDRMFVRIPLLNRLLLGPDDNLVAAYYKLTGPWTEPEARLVPLRSFTAGPGSLVFETLPDVLKRGWRALGGALGGAENADADAAGGPASPASGS